MAVFFPKFKSPNGSLVPVSVLVNPEKEIIIIRSLYTPSVHTIRFMYNEGKEGDKPFEIYTQDVQYYVGRNTSLSIRLYNSSLPIVFMFSSTSEVSNIISLFENMNMLSLAQYRQIRLESGKNVSKKFRNLDVSAKSVNIVNVQKNINSPPSANVEASIGKNSYDESMRFSMLESSGKRNMSFEKTKGWKEEIFVDKEYSLECCLKYATKLYYGYLVFTNVNLSFYSRFLVSNNKASVSLKDSKTGKREPVGTEIFSAQYKMLDNILRLAIDAIGIGKKRNKFWYQLIFLLTNGKFFICGFETENERQKCLDMVKHLAGYKPIDVNEEDCPEFYTTEKGKQCYEECDSEEENVNDRYNKDNNFENSGEGRNKSLFKTLKTDDDYALGETGRSLDSHELENNNISTNKDEENENKMDRVFIMSSDNNDLEEDLDRLREDANNEKVLQKLMSQQNFEGNIDGDYDNGGENFNIRPHGPTLQDYITGRIGVNRGAGEQYEQNDENCDMTRRCSNIAEEYIDESLLTPIIISAPEKVETKSSEKIRKKLHKIDDECQQLELELSAKSQLSKHKGEGGFETKDSDVVEGVGGSGSRSENTDEELLAINVNDSDGDDVEIQIINSGKGRKLAGFEDDNVKNEKILLNDERTTEIGLEKSESGSGEKIVGEKETLEEHDPSNNTRERSGKDPEVDAKFNDKFESNNESDVLAGEMSMSANITGVTGTSESSYIDQEQENTNHESSDYPSSSSSSSDSSKNSITNRDKSQNIDVMTEKEKTNNEVTSENVSNPETNVVSSQEVEKLPSSSNLQKDSSLSISDSKKNEINNTNSVNNIEITGFGSDSPLKSVEKQDGSLLEKEPRNLHIEGIEGEQYFKMLSFVLNEEEYKHLETLAPPPTSPISNSLNSIVTRFGGSKAATFYCPNDEKTVSPDLINSISTKINPTEEKIEIVLQREHEGKDIVIPKSRIVLAIPGNKLKQVEDLASGSVISIPDDKTVTFVVESGENEKRGVVLTFAIKLYASKFIDIINTYIKQNNSVN